MTKKIPISEYYDLSRFGRYRAVAYVKILGSDRDAFRSPHQQFLITSGRTIFSQKIGLPNTSNARKYDVIMFNGSDISEIYVKIVNDYTGQTISCKALSPIQTFRDPKAALDRNNNLHLLYLVTPTLYIHHVVTPTGKIVKRNYHKQGAIGEPRLDSFANGEVKVAGTVLYDPKKARKEAAKQKKLSDRPNFVY